MLLWSTAVARDFSTSACVVYKLVVLDFCLVCVYFYFNVICKYLFCHDGKCAIFTHQLFYIMCVEFFPELIWLLCDSVESRGIQQYLLHIIGSVTSSVIR